MTTEQCSIDSLLPKSRTETFARRLQNRLRTLNAESERDGLEDTSWNGDQLSSSSDDIFYDVDSLPGSPVGSPAEEAAETDYTDYINVKKSADNVCSPSSTSQFLNHEYSVQSGSDDVDCCYFRQYSRPNAINGTNSDACYCFDTPERECVFCDQCTTSKNIDGVSVSTTNERVKNIPRSCSNHNGLVESHETQSGQSDSNINRNGTLHDISRFNCLNDLSTSKENDQVQDITNNFNGVEDRLLNNEFYANIEKNLVIDTNPNILHGYESETDFEDCCSCNHPSSESKSIDVNRNSSVSNNNIHCYSNDHQIDNMTSGLSIISSPEKQALSNAVPKEHEWLLNNGNHERKNNQKSNVDYYTEEDLTRLVDTVFLKSQEKDFDIDCCCDLITGINSGDVISDRKDNVKDEDDNNSEEVEESIESRRSKFRRCSSLKSGKTPPGTPGCKKIVRFADVLGLDLADVRTFLDEIPKVPKSAFTDLKNVESSSSPPIFTSMLESFMERQNQATTCKSNKTIVPLFQQPSSRPDFMDRVRNNFVCLENSIISDMTLFVITGFVRVRNIGFNKSVHIRYSIDNWKSFADLQAKYVPNSCDGFSDKFTFVLYAHMLNVGQRLEFAVRYHACDSQFWDNNFGANYTFQCVPNGPAQSTPTLSYVPPPTMETWASFY